MNEPMAYIGRKACGCVVAATVDEPEYARDTAREVAGFVRDGLTVERMTVAAAQSLIHSCRCAAPSPARAGQPALPLEVTA